MLMVDDERFPLKPGEVPEQRIDPFPHARLLSADRRRGSRGHDPAGSDPGNAADHHLRAPGPRDRPRPGAPAWRRRSRKGISDGQPTPSYQADALIAADIDAYLLQHQHKSLLRFITCGSVDDGKSTLIGRLLYDSKMIFEDQLAALEADSQTCRHARPEYRFRLLVDGLAAEREQGITIDVAYRFFATEKRKFIVADTPGHEQYTRNMVTGASTADLAVILIDARKGVLTQTRRHSYLAHLIGISNIVLAVNKMDLIGYDQAKYDAIVADYRAFANSIGIEEFVADADLRLRRATTSPPIREHALVSGPAADPASGNGRAGRDRVQRKAVPHAGAMGQPAEPRFPRFLRSDRQRQRSSRAMRSACCPRARPPPSRASSRWMAIWRRRWPGNPSRSASPMRSIARAAT